MNQPLSTSDRGPDLTAPPLPRRMACWIYEGMLMFGVVFIAGYLFSTLTQTRHALERIEDASYGQCESCGEPIGKARLQAFPRVTLCMTCKQKQERR